MSAHILSALKRHLWEKGYSEGVYRETHREGFQFMVDLPGLSLPRLYFPRETVMTSFRTWCWQTAWALSPLSEKWVPHQARPQDWPQLDMPKGFSGGSDGEESACNEGDLGLIPGSGRFPGEGNGNPLQYFCCRIPLTEESGGLQSMGSQRFGHDCVTHKKYFI